MPNGEVLCTSFRSYPTTRTTRLIQHLLFAATLSVAAPLSAVEDAPYGGVELLGIEHIHDADATSIDPAHQALQTLEKRLNVQQCKAMGRTLLKIGTSAAVVASVNEATSLADKVCVDHNNPTCSNYVSYVRRAMNIVFLLAGYVHGAVGSGPHNTDETVINGAVRRSLDLNSTFDLAAMLKVDGYSFQTVETVSLAELGLEKREDEPSLESRTIIRGLLDDEEETATPSDIAINHFANGEFDLQFGGLAPVAGGNETTTHLHKRYAGAGIKVPFTTRTPSKLTRAHQRQMSAAIATNWGQIATTQSYHMNEYFGLVKTGHAANFYFRIIPEVRGFGLNYESVNACGGMAKYL